MDQTLFAFLVTSATIWLFVWMTIDAFRPIRSESLRRTVTILSVKVSPIEITENLFFAIFGQKNTEDFVFSLNRNMQPAWTIYLFKVFFSLYMLVSVIVLINLLIAMMSNTYQRISSQSDIEWKFGLSRLIRKMQKTRTAPSPLNLFSTWLEYLVKTCRKKRQKERPTGIMQAFTGPDGLPKYPFSGDNGIVSLQQNPLGSQLSLKEMPKVEDIVDWEVVRRKYRIRFGGGVETPSQDDTGAGAD